VERGAAPPPVQSSKPGVCDSGGGKVVDAKAAAFFPRVSGQYCVDPNGETRAYGEDAKGTLDEVCTQQFDGECEIYKGFGLRRVVMVRYADGAGSPGAVSVTLSAYGSEEGAYGFFTKRIVADGDPVKVAPKLLQAAGRAALGSGIAYAWRGKYVAELSYTNELEPPDRIRESSQAVLPPLTRAIGEKLPGDQTPPSAVEALPADKRVPLGVRYEYHDVLGVSGVGKGAVGYYQDGERRYRVFALVRTDEDAAKDVIDTLKKLDGANALKDLPINVLHVPEPRDDGGPPIEWLVARRAERVFGVGDEPLVIGSEQSAEERAKLSLDRDAKIALLKGLVAP
jgi:hypothetical protein